MTNTSDTQQIIREAVARVDYLDEAPRQIAHAIAQAYVRGLEYSHGEEMISPSVQTKHNNLLELRSFPILCRGRNRLSSAHEK